MLLEELLGPVQMINTPAIHEKFGVVSRLLKNPTIPVLFGLLKRSCRESLRGLICSENIWWWDAEYALHGDVAKNLNHENYIDDRLNLDLVMWNSATARFNCCDAWTFDRIMAHPQLSRLAQSPSIYFELGGHGWLPGPEWVASHQRSSASSSAESITR